MAVFLLIGKTSALTMNIAGVVKDWILIGLSVMLYKCAPAHDGSLRLLPEVQMTGCPSLMPPHDLDGCSSESATLPRFM